MGLFLDAAKAWNALCETTYTIEVGRKNQQYTIDLSFEAADFPHLAGMQYAKDVDFKLRPAEYYGKNLIPAIVSGKLDETLICKATKWDKRIKGRLSAIIHIQQALEQSFVLAQFNPNRVKGSCDIDAKYVLKDNNSGITFFIFLDERSGRFYCKSAFQKSFLDYTENQAIMTVLQVTKTTAEGASVLYKHPNYRAKELVDA